MAHANIDKHLYRLDDPFAAPREMLERTPGSSRVERRRGRSTTPSRPVKKGLARSAVNVVRIKRDEYEVRLKVGGVYLGKIRKTTTGGKAYAYQLANDRKSHDGFATQKAAVERLLTKI